MWVQHLVCTYEFLGLIAGGYGAIVKAVEGAEDKKELCVEDLKNNNFTSKDLLVGVAAYLEEHHMLSVALSMLKRLVLRQLVYVVI